MPILIVTTNHNADEATVDKFTKQAVATMSAILKKPEQIFMVGVNKGARMVFECNGDPTLYAEFVGQGDVMDGNVKKRLITSLSAVVEGNFGIPNTRTFIKVYDTVWGKKIMNSKL
ncbi:unnamed protein product [Cuscuta campestris]|uniref:Macrophage migration inhibitory factor n=1 Tax=Cuscuta campestris TaxID=132261 RepID=A0A484M818_9ASTE|nr:unnamed protein product [Cuscuta campestris]